MGSQLITGLAQATAAGHALRYEANGAGTLPTTALFPTATTATNHTESEFVASDEGVTLTIASATATNRCSSRTGAGSLIAGRIHRTERTPGAGGSGFVVGNASGQFIVVTWTINSITALRFTDKDTYAASVLGATTFYGSPGPVEIRVGDLAGAFVVQYREPGATLWNTLHTGTYTTAWGSDVPTTKVGIGCYGQSATGIYAMTLSRCTITAVA
jgi:hypothetical protein